VNTVGDEILALDSGVFLVTCMLAFFLFDPAIRAAACCCGNALT